MNSPADPATLRAALWMIGAVVSFTLMAVAGRAVSPELDTFELMLYRSLMGFVIVAGIVLATGRAAEITRRRLGLQTVRNISHFAGQNLWFHALTLAPLTVVFALEFTMPLWVTVMAIALLGERLTPLRIVTALAGFVGILIITQPWAMALGPGVVPAALAAIGFAGSTVLTKLLTRTETALCILFWLTVMQGVFGLVTAGWDGDIALPSAAALPWVAVVGIGGLVAHFCLTTALTLAPATVVVPVDFIRLPIIAVVGLVFYDETVETAVFLGAALILAANWINLRAAASGR